MPDKPPALPTPPNLHALQNRISLSLSSRTQLFANKFSSSSSSTPTVVVAHTQSPDLELDLRSIVIGGDANAGVGYVPAKNDMAIKAQDKFLRGKLLNGRKDEAARRLKKKKKKEEESDEEEDDCLGRSVLGKKRKRTMAGGGEEIKVEPLYGSGDDVIHYDEIQRKSQDAPRADRRDTENSQEAPGSTSETIGRLPEKKKRNKNKGKHKETPS